VLLADREDLLVAEILPMALGDAIYPGTIGACPDWPGVTAGSREANNAILSRFCDLAGMVTQVRAVLGRARGNGGRVREEVFTGCGHSPHGEQPGRFGELLGWVVASA
jgi:pimeloyl-ACP methyl ester carboxylesterase